MPGAVPGGKGAPKMKWTKDKSIRLSIVCVFAFAAILLALDLYTFFTGGPAASEPMDEYASLARYSWDFFRITVFFGSICAWICLWELYRLLKNIQREEVFTKENTRHLRLISWCCLGAAAVCLLSALYAWPFLIVAIAAAFMMLIVRVVKNCFQQAIDMKAELDLTI